MLREEIQVRLVLVKLAHHSIFGFKMELSTLDSEVVWVYAKLKRRPKTFMKSSRFNTVIFMFKS